MAWSATSVVFDPGTLQAITPSSVAASRSMESTPTPNRLTTFSFGHDSRTRREVSGMIPTWAPSASFSRSIISSSLRHVPS